MPSTLYMLGNGFDLAHKLPTAYCDFFYFVEEIKRLSSNPTVPHTSSANSNLPQSTLEYLEGIFKLPSIPGYIQAIQSALCFNTPRAENLWHSYFRKKLNEKLNLNTWIDFEKEIENEINSVRSLLFCDTISSSPIEMMKIIYRNMGNYLFTPFDRSWPEKELSKYEIAISTVIDCGKDASSLIPDYRKECSLFLYHELQRYIFCLELYLRFYVMERCFIPEKPNGFLQNLFDVNHPDFILSFNYTDTYANYLEQHQSEDVSKQHIHGKLRTAEQLSAAIKEQDYLHSPLVLGFNNHEKFETSEDIQLLWFEKFFQRMLCKTGTDFFSWNNQVVDDEIHTIIYGHSLDKTDGDFIRSIFKSSSKITVYYYQESNLPQLISNLILVFNRNQVNYYYTTGILEFLPIPQDT